MNRRVILVAGMGGHAYLVSQLIAEKLKDAKVVAELNCRQPEVIDFPSLQSEVIDFPSLQSWVNTHEVKKLDYTDSIGQKVREKMSRQHFSMKHLRKIK